MDPLEECLHQPSSQSNAHYCVPSHIVDQVREIAQRLTLLLRTANPKQYHHYKVEVSGSTRFGIADVDAWPVSRRGLVPKWVRDAINDRIPMDAQRPFEEGLTYRVAFTVRPDLDAVFHTFEQANAVNDKASDLTDLLEVFEEDGSLRGLSLSTVCDDLNFTARREGLLPEAYVLPLISMGEDGQEGNNNISSSLRAANQDGCTMYRPYVALPFAFLQRLLHNGFHTDDEHPLPHRLVGMLMLQGPDTMLEDMFDRYCRIAPPLLPFAQGFYGWCSTHGFRWAPEYLEWTALPEQLGNTPANVLTSAQHQDLSKRCIAPNALFLLTLYFVIKDQKVLPSLSALIPTSSSAMTAMELQRLLNHSNSHSSAQEQQIVDLALLGSATGWLMDGGLLFGLSRGERSVEKLMSSSAEWFTKELVPLYDAASIVKEFESVHGVPMDGRLLLQQDAPEPKTQHSGKQSKATSSHDIGTTLRNHLFHCAKESLRIWTEQQEYTRTSVLSSSEEKEAFLMNVLDQILSNKEYLEFAHKAKNCMNCNAKVEVRSASRSHVLLCQSCEVKEAKVRNGKEADAMVVVNEDGICVGCQREVSYLKGKLIEVQCNACRF